MCACVFVRERERERSKCASGVCPGDEGSAEGHGDPVTLTFSLH